MSDSPRTPLVVHGTSRRAVVIATAIGTGLLALILWTNVMISKGVVNNGLTGIIVDKQFTPQPEQQITIGKEGFSERHVDGEYRLEVRVDGENGGSYYVWVDKTVYDAKKVGDKFYFVRPKPQQ